MNLGYHHLNWNKDVFDHVKENKTLAGLVSAKIMHHTITRCMDDSSDDAKNASYLNFKEGNPDFDYWYYFNESFFVDAFDLLKNESLLEQTEQDKKYNGPI